MYKFGHSSRRELKTLHPTLQSILHELIKDVNFTVVQGYRTKEEQNNMFREGKTQLKYPQSKHNKEPSRAVDIAPYVPDVGIPWDDYESFAYLAGRVMGEAKRQDAQLRWGGDWDKDGYLIHQDDDEDFYDPGHIELREGLP